ncbi:MAG TPA: hypothetical protein V6D14_03130 [Coleofasciculaceae cyanobacterium]|jgi:hypothetical protein
MDRSKIIAIITGAISLLLAIAYLTIVQLLDFRGEMIPAPVSQLPQGVEVASLYPVEMFPSPGLRPATLTSPSSPNSFSH